MSVNHGLPSGALSMAQISLLNMPGVNSTISIRLQYTGLLLCSMVIGRTFTPSGMFIMEASVANASANFFFFFFYLGSGVKLIFLNC